MIGDSFEMPWVRVLTVNFSRWPLTCFYKQKNHLIKNKSSPRTYLSSAACLVWISTCSYISSWFFLVNATQTSWQWPVCFRFFNPKFNSSLKKLPIDLTAIFCPGFILQPQHETLFKEHALNQKVLEFLIPQQDWGFLHIGHLASNWTMMTSHDELRGGSLTHQPGLFFRHS